LIFSRLVITCPGLQIYFLPCHSHSCSSWLTMQSIVMRMAFCSGVLCFHIGFCINTRYSFSHPPSVNCHLPPLLHHSYGAGGNAPVLVCYFRRHTSFVLFSPVPPGWWKLHSLPFCVDFIFEYPQFNFQLQYFFIATFIVGFPHVTLKP